MHPHDMYSDAYYDRYSKTFCARNEDGTVEFRTKDLQEVYELMQRERQRLREWEEEITPEANWSWATPTAVEPIAEVVEIEPEKLHKRKVHFLNEAV